MIIRSDFRGVTSIIRALTIEPNQYHNMLHFYRSTAFNIPHLKLCWIRIVMNHVTLKTLEGHILGVGDHSKFIKEGKYIPAVKKHQQESENAGKGEYIFGHEHGLIGLLTNSPNMQCIGVNIEIHDGMDDVKALDSEAKIEKSTSAIKLMKMVEKLVYELKKPLIMLLDAGFSVGDVFKKAVEINRNMEQNLLTIITRAKKNYVGYEKAPAIEMQGKGRPKKYGAGINLMNQFETALNKFATVKLNIYGKQEAVQYLYFKLV